MGFVWAAMSFIQPTQQVDSTSAIPDNSPVVRAEDSNERATSVVTLRPVAPEHSNDGRKAHERTNSTIQRDSERLNTNLAASPTSEAVTSESEPQTLRQSATQNQLTDTQRSNADRSLSVSTTNSADRLKPADSPDLNHHNEIIKSDGDDWPQFRGYNGAGSSDLKGLPTRWDSRTNIVWNEVRRI